MGSWHQRLLLWAALTGAAACSVYDPELADTRQSVQGNTGQAGAGAGGSSDDCKSSAGTCTRPNAVATCVNSACLIVSCDTPYADCDDNPDNGCEADLTSTDHCGLCNAACKLSHAGARCESGRCMLDKCESGFDDCDDNPNNGCERGIASVRDCGKCGGSCDKPAHATAGCDTGRCGVGQCDPGYGDCNHELKDGCEQPLNDLAHCGSCDSSCQRPHVAKSECENGSCVVTGCEPGWEDCNGKPEDGCEANLAAADSCGACGRSCTLPHVAQASCDQVNDKPQCDIDKRCAEGQTCDKSVRGCAKGYADCDDKPDNGCETDVTRLNNCGGCGKSCVADHAIMACENDKCVNKGCDPGYGHCSELGGCVSLLNDPKNCGQCGKACGGDTPQCAGGRCTAQTCDATHADCDGQSNNQCETNLTDAMSCGGCGVVCPAAPHTTAQCRDGRCQIGPCQTGYADCDGDPRNGCEVALSGLNDCGGCNQPCIVPHGEPRCEQGKCQVARCDDGRADCNQQAADGCESDLGSPVSCRGCGMSCRGLPNVAASSCGEDGCDLQCQDMRADCDGQLQNGCEADLTAAQSCGSCARNCTTLPNVTAASCSQGACRDLTCAAGTGDCNDDAADGCERLLRTANDCGACDQPCAPAHAQADCSTGQCKISKCDPGYGDCDGDPKNGCEALLNSPSHCGACDKACANGSTCSNGVCGCGAAQDCGPGQGCCDGKCVSTIGACYVWPCIPGTDVSANRLNCGGCGNVCLTWCCSDLLGQ